MLHSIVIDGRAFSFSGEETDPFFIRLPEFFAGNAAFNSYVSRSVPRDAVCVDVGGNIGLTVATMAQHCSGGRVYAFEPSPVNFRHLEANVRRNDMKNVGLSELAIGSANGHINFLTPAQAANSRALRGDPSSLDHVRVPVIKLDDWVEQTKLDRVDFIKIDVEGFEPEVLSGAAETILRFNPEIFMEFNSLAMIFESRVNPLSFAEGLWRTFDIWDVDADGSRERIYDPSAFTHANVTQHGFMDDILMRLKSRMTSCDIVNAISGFEKAPLLADNR